MDVKELKIEYLPTDQLTPYENNANIHTDLQVDQIVSSIKEFGFNDPIAIWDDENGNHQIVEGHGRVLAAKKLGIDTLPIVRLNDLSDEQRRAYTHVHNQLTRNSEFDWDTLDEELANLNFEWDALGFSEFLPDDLYIQDGEIVEDEVPEVDETSEPKAKPGDIYKLGKHRLMCGDGTKDGDVSKLMDGAKADMVFTDPPYGYSYQSNMRVNSEKFDVIKNDDKKLNFFPMLKKYNDGFVYVCTTWKVVDDWISIFKSYYELTNIIIWDKGCGGMGDLLKTFATDYEMILVCNNGKEIVGKRYGSVWDFTTDEIKKMKKDELLNMVLKEREYYSIWRDKKDNNIEYVHPTQKPVSLSGRAIRSSTGTGQKVLDLFGGSGSTLMACEQTGRKCYMMELDPRYVDVIIKRWEKFTGNEAVLLNG